MKDKKIERLTSRLRVLMICPQFRPIVGGYERAAERLSAELVQRGCDVTVITERRLKDWKASELVNGFAIKRYWCVYRPRLHGLTSLLSFSIFLLLHGRKFHIFHVHQYGYHAGLTILFGRLLRKPVLLKSTNTGPEGISNIVSSTKSKGKGWLLALHKKVDAFIVTSNAAMREALALGIPENRVFLIPNGLNISEYAPSGHQERLDRKKKLGLEGKLVVLYVGRLSEQKNPLGLAKAWAQVCIDIPGAVLVYVGPGPQLDALKDQIASLGCEGSVRLVGTCADVLPWYQASDVYVLPSHNEGLSNSLLEAMACGLPVVSTRVSGSEDIFAEADIGELVEVGDQDGIADGLKRMLENPEQRIKCGATARTYVELNFSLDSIVDKMVGLYESMVRK